MLFLSLVACSNTPLKPNIHSKEKFKLNTLYDYQLFNSATQKSISVKELTLSVQTSNVIFLGEFHTHHASHKLQLDFLQALYKNNPRIVLSMEQFTRDAQPVLDQYLSGKYGEETLIYEANAWEDYKGSYRALVEFAKEHQIPIIAANAPAMFVRCVGRRGAEFLKTLPQEKSTWAARQLDLDNEKYKAKFMQFIKESGRSHGQTNEVASKRQLNTYAAQLLRDTTMAESIVDALSKYPNHQIVHLNGAFHSDNHLGTVAVLETMLPEIKTSVVSPIMQENPAVDSLSFDQGLYAQGDYVYLVKDLPNRYLDEEKEMAAITKLIRERMKKKCEL